MLEGVGCLVSVGPMLPGSAAGWNLVHLSPPVFTDSWPTAVKKTAELQLNFINMCVISGVFHR